VGRTVVIHTPEQTVEGVLTYASGALLILRGAVLPAAAGRDATPLDGEVVVERQRVVFGQVV